MAASGLVTESTHTNCSNPFEEPTHKYLSKYRLHLPAYKAEESETYVTNIKKALETEARTNYPFMLDGICGFLGHPSVIERVISFVQKDIILKYKFETENPNTYFCKRNELRCEPNPFFCIFANCGRNEFHYREIQCPLAEENGYSLFHIYMTHTIVPTHGWFVRIYDQTDYIKAEIISDCEEQTSWFVEKLLCTCYDGHNAYIVFEDIAREGVKLLEMKMHRVLTKGILTPDSFSWNASLVSQTKSVDSHTIVPGNSPFQRRKTIGE